MRSKVKFLVHLLTILTLVASTGIPGLAQNATGSIKGTVKDPNNAVVANASVTATNKATGAVRKNTSGSEGNFVLENLTPGEYEVKVEAQGFAAQIQVLNVAVGSTTSGEFAMSVGTVTQTVEVAGGAPVINTTDTVVGGVINRDKVENLPLNGRSFLSVAGLEPGVGIAYNGTSGAGNPNNYFQVSIGGAPQQMTVIAVDGARVNDRITGGTSQNFSAETVQEFQISTLGFDLSSGTVSAGAVNIVSRTGGNGFHGGGFFFFRDHNLAAFSGLKRPSEIQPSGRPLNPLCLNPAACERLQDPFFVRKQYGGTFGGPIKKDKLFFFANYEHGFQIGANSVTFADPTLATFNHIARTPQDGDLVGVRLDYTVNQKHTAFLRGNVDSNDGTSGAGLESRWIASSNYAYQTQMGLTSVFKPTFVNDFRFSYSYFRNRLRQPTQAECESLSGDPRLCFGIDGPQITFYGGLVTGTNVNVSQDRHPRTYQWSDNVNWTIGSHRVRFGGNWEHSNAHGTWAQNTHGTFTAFSPTTVAALAPAIYAALPASLKPNYVGPPITFDDLLSLPMTGTLAIGIGDIGQPARPFNYEKVLANDHISFYAQDAWQARPGFTINYGLGWSFENNILYHDLDFPAYLKPIVGNDLGKLPYQYKNFDPALGFAWALGKEQKTVVRSSLSLHHISPNVGFFNLNQRILLGPAGNGLQATSGAGLPNPEAAGLLNFPLAPTNFTLRDMLAYLPAARAALIASAPFNGTNPALRGINVTKTVAGPQFLDAIYNADSAKTPYTIQLDVGVQREIMHNLSLSADYVMRRGVGFGAFELFFPDSNLWSRFLPYGLTPNANGSATIVAGARNPVIPACTAVNTNDPTANCSKGPIQYGMPGILSRYSALQFKLDKRFSGGLQFTGAYSWANYTTFSGVTSNIDLHDGHGRSTGLPIHRFTGSAIWELPKYKGDLKALRGIVNDWQLSTIVQIQSGAPTTVNLSGPLAAFGAGLGGFDVEGDGSFIFRLPGSQIGGFGSNMNANDIRRLVEQYNATIPAAKDTLPRDITRAQRDAVGNPFPYIVLPDNFAYGDSVMTHDLRLTRIIRVGEKVKLNLIAEGFNIFNIANLTGFSGNLNAYVRPTVNAAGLVTAGSNPNLTFGQPDNRVNATFGSGGPRAFQLALRLSF